MIKYIFEINIKPDCTEEQYINAWEKGSKIIQASSAEAYGTTLYKTEEPGVLMAIASWQSKQGRKDAMEKLNHANEQIKLTINAHRNFGEIKKIGYIDEISTINEFVKE